MNGFNFHRIFLYLYYLMSKSHYISGGFLRKAGLCLALTATAFLTFASKGGGGDKNKNGLSFNKEFTPVRTAGGFTLKVGPSYSGSQLLSSQKKKDVVFYNSIVTYSKGNNTYILPYKYRVNLASKTSSKSSLNLVDIKIKLGK